MSTDHPAHRPVGRYGPEPRLGRRARVVVLALLGVAAVAVALWLGMGTATRPVTWQDVGFTLADDQVEVVFDVVRRDPSTPVRCTVEALNHQYAQVGVVEVDVPPGTGTAVRHVAVVRISEPAVTGLVRGCAPG